MAADKASELKFAVFKGQQTIAPEQWAAVAKCFAQKVEGKVDSAQFDFSVVDTNKDGVISEEEYEQFVNAIEEVVGKSQFKEVLTGVFESYKDTDNWRYNPEAMDHIIRQLFDNKDHVTFEDIMPLLQSQNPGSSEEELKAEFDKADNVKDGKLSVIEFCDFFVDMEKVMEVRLDVTKGGLTKSRVYARMRPFSTDGTGHAADSEEVDKKLEKFDAQEIQVKDRHKVSKYTFPNEVLLPEASQQKVFDTIMPDLFDAWSIQMKNVMLFAYGQTGTGKTHTMFGSEASLKSNDPHDDWGLFPRLVHATVKRMEGIEAAWPSTRWKLCASGVEFYLGMAFDLLNNKMPLTIGPDSKPVAADYVNIKNVTDLKEFIDRVYGNRTVAATKMNKGSSRSHCGLILTLHQYGDDPEGKGTPDKKPMMGCYTSTTFTIFDLAGSERVSKTGGKRMNVMEAIGTVCAKGVDAIPKKEITGAQGAIINWELSMLGTEAIKAAECYANKKKYCPPKALVTDTAKVFGGCLDGHSVCGMILCISQAPSNGWETWFSCEMGQQLAKLKAPSIDEKIRRLPEEIKAVKKRLKTAEESLAKTPTSGPQAKWRPSREATVHGLKRYLEILDEILENADPKPE